ncbi:hypothetical protein [Bosea sp. TND4EK4]|uniref:hypothetical protein n=1 Tax=Bosea sp. TND4EK4 TaxID=1907408 RepID=UPI000956E212|nr:hypothetical protein [Bosea sp. TND4EK4]SIQ59962.1 hypothetical protein SAMN05880592_10489 [Bosea sp. TND4EK4]
MNRRQHLKITGLSDAKLKYLARNNLTPTVQGASAEREGYNGYGVNEALMTRLAVALAQNSIDQGEASTTVVNGYSAMLERHRNDFVPGSEPIYFGLCKVLHHGMNEPFAIFGPINDLAFYHEHSGERLPAAGAGFALSTVSLVNFSQLLVDVHAAAQEDGIAPVLDWIAELSTPRGGEA